MNYEQWHKKIYTELYELRGKNKQTEKTGEKEEEKKIEQVQEINIPPHPSITAIVLVT